MSISTNISKPTKESKKNPIIQKMLDDKNSITAYFRGEITLQELHSKGIKLVKPV